MPTKEDKLERILQDADEFWYGELPPHQVEYFKGRINGLKVKVITLRRELDELKGNSREKKITTLPLFERRAGDRRIKDRRDSSREILNHEYLTFD